MTDDAALLEAWRSGDTDAGESLFERYYESIVWFFRNKVVDDVEDLVHQTFAACVEGRDRVRSASSFRAYLFGAAHNILRVHLRKLSGARQVIDFSEVSVQDIAPGPSSIVARHREQQLLLEALRALPVDYQVLLELRYWEDLKTIEIAESFAEPHSTIRSRLQRAHALLERQMARLAQSPDLLRSTLVDFDAWVRDCRGRQGAAARAHDD